MVGVEACPPLRAVCLPCRCAGVLHGVERPRYPTGGCRAERQPRHRFCCVARASHAWSLGSCLLTGHTGLSVAKSLVRTRKACFPSVEHGHRGSSTRAALQRPPEADPPPLPSVPRCSSSRSWMGSCFWVQPNQGSGCCGVRSDESVSLEIFSKGRAPSTIRVTVLLGLPTRQ